jgi:hypothetical protein
MLLHRLVSDVAGVSVMVGAISVTPVCSVTFGTVVLLGSCVGDLPGDAHAVKKSNARIRLSKFLICFTFI